ncbi:FkbM family methyltransferase [Sphingomonas lacunae]|uniref:FkbM family methyltransferase n=1 Tax=Sphingomonas lacunae TaxID=2698828 RepID=A0A6M4ATZ4_9SPHN|nr:FkbM family methyltransferase [Sphingomonas lacunae]QJQ32573.1 FkbM family methyltransferase [Sphingomonas lacunae]
MIGGFWRYGLIKTLRKAYWLSLARGRARQQDSEQRSQGAGMTAYGVLMQQNWHDRTFVYCHAGIYGRFLADRLEQRASAFTFVDIGANQGLYSLIAGRNPACRRAIAFEPVSATFATLQSNIMANGLDQKIQPLRLAISDQAGPLTITVPDGHSGMASLVTSPDRQSVNSRTETIEAVTADRLDTLLDGDDPLIVKVDVEGQELAVIRQLLKSAIAPRIAAIFYEVDTRWSDSATIAQLLRDSGFAHFRKVGFGHHFDMMASRSPQQGI